MEPYQQLQATLRLRRKGGLYIVAGLLALALFLPSPAWSALALGSASIYGLMYGWVRLFQGRVFATRQVRRRWVAVGDRLDESFEIHNFALLPLIWVAVEDDSNVPGYAAGVVRSVGAGRSDRWRQQALCTMRGRFTLGPWTLSISDPLGLFELRLHDASTQEIVIHPPIHIDLPLELPAGLRSGGVRRQMRWQLAQQNAVTVRDYTPGDPYHHIHWPSTARREALMTRMFEQDAAGNVWLLLDLDRRQHVGSDQSGTLEQMILLAASLTAQGLRQNRAIGLAAYGVTPILIPPGRGQGHQWRLLRALALAQPSDAVALEHALADVRRSTRRRAAVLILTATAETDWMPALLQLAQGGVWVEAAVFDRSSYGGDDNRHVAAAVRRAGIHCTRLQAGDVGRPVHRPEQETRLRVTPLGKVVEVGAA